MNTGLAAFHGETEIRNQTDLQSLTGKTLRVEAGSAPTVGGQPEPVHQPAAPEHRPAGVLHGNSGTLLLETPLGQSGLAHQGLRYEVAKVFGLWSRKLDF